MPLAANFWQYFDPYIHNRISIRIYTHKLCSIHVQTHTRMHADRHTRMWIRVLRADSTSSCRHLLFSLEEGMLRDAYGSTDAPVSKEEAQPFFSERECVAVLQGSMDALFFSERECFAVLQGSMDALQAKRRHSSNW